MGLLDIDKGVFNSDIDIDSLYEYADGFINNNRDSGILKYGKLVYRFNYPNCGIIKTGEVANGICVVTSLRDKNIIAMYPVVAKDFVDVINKDDKKNVSKKLVRVKSGLDRFNERYNK